MPQNRNLTRRLVGDRAATDPILVIAAIAVSLVLLVGGSFAVAGIVGNGHDLNARADLDKVAVAQVAQYAATDRFADYDSAATADADLRTLEDAMVGFNPTAGGRVLVDARATEWVAASYAPTTQRVFVRTSGSSAVGEVLEGQIAQAAGNGSSPARTVTLTSNVTLPVGFDLSDVAAMEVALRTGAPYHGVDAAPTSDRLEVVASGLQTIEIPAGTEDGAWLATAWITPTGAAWLADQRSTLTEEAWADIEDFDQSLRDGVISGTIIPLMPVGWVESPVTFADGSSDMVGVLLYADAATGDIVAVHMEAWDRPLDAAQFASLLGGAVTVTMPSGAELGIAFGASTEHIVR